MLFIFMGRPPKGGEDNLIKIAARRPSKIIDIIDKLAEENDRDRSGEINHALRFYTRFASQAHKRGMTPDELQQWLYKEVAELSEKYDRLEGMIEKLALEKE